MDNISLETPLTGSPYKFTIADPKKINSFQGPKRAIRLLLLCIILPALLISVPLYLKHRVYEYQIYPFGMSDMRLLDSRVSTTWCQRQLVKANVTFNAFLMAEQPIIAKDRLHVSMTRHLTLRDDMKEYWGFYLLKNSTVTVSSCSRWPGASLIVIRGHHHLHECAYIGDDSSEELNELMEIAAEKGIQFDPTKYDSSESSDSSNNPSNNPDRLRKGAGTGIEFHDPILKENANSFTFPPKTMQKEIEENLNTKQMKELLNTLSYKKGEKSKLNKIVRKNENPNNIEDHPAIVKIRPTNYGVNEKKNIHIADENRESEFGPSEASFEIYKNVLEKLSKMGPKGKRILDLLKEKLIFETDDNSISTSTMSTTLKNDKNNGEKLNNIYGKMNDENEMEEENIIRLKRNIFIKTVMGHEFNQDDENENLAVEEDYKPDGIADHHHILNETTFNDRSNSEFWSSFSSSEEALLNCAGLILSLPLNPHRHCESHRNANDFNDASFSNTITYTTPTNGYYFFVFNSENEIQDNYLRVHFDLHKTIYNVSNSISKCSSNTTNQCNFKLNFFSNEKVVFEYPMTKNNESLWNEEYIVISECEPRTIVYLICVLSVPLIILLFAFQ